ncbi:hypothetical protein LC612_02080 [Nostoc sp. CHAB 5834]|nr:hypothetical protein [Nostoc sp. CHAB 5834]
MGDRLGDEGKSFSSPKNYRFQDRRGLVQEWIEGDTLTRISSARSLSYSHSNAGYFAAFPPKLLSKLEQQNIEYISKYQDRYSLRYFKK